MSWDDGSGAQWPRWKPWDFFGYYNLGPVAVPTAVPIVGMTDRTTGKVWYLCFDPSNGNRVSLTDAAPTANPLRVYAAFDGPYIGQFGLRLGVDQVNGTTHVVFDAADHDSGTPPAAFQLNSGNTQYAQIEATSLGAVSVLDHLVYEILLRTPANPTGPVTPPATT